MKSDLSKVKAGDKIWTIQEGWVEVVWIDNSDCYPITTQLSKQYTIDGKRLKSDKYPSAFLEYPFGEEPIEKDTLVWFRDGEKSYWRVGYYSHFDDGHHYVFDYSKKSTETDQVIRWNIVTTENPLS